MKLIEIAKFTDKVAEVSSFYRQFLGVKPVAASPDMTIFINDGVKIFIHKIYEAGTGDLPPEDHFAFAVEDVDKTCEDLQTRGLMVETPPNDYYWGRSAYLRDPDGQLIELTQVT
ncbi:MAG: VOC family protein [Anaerolineales bacterium]|nr:VOC family protein [Anaerolineales bacterium]